MSDKRPDERSSLNYKAGFMSALVIFISSIFMYVMIWIAYEKLDYSEIYNFITPLILCFMYHGVMLDTDKNGSFSGKFFFIFSVIIPLLTSLALTGIMYAFYPDLSVFNNNTSYKAAPIETIAVYSGRIVYTSVYLLVFVLIDIPFIRKFKSERKKK